MNKKRNIVSPSTFPGCIHKILVSTHLKSGLLKFKEKSGCLPSSMYDTVVASAYRILITTLFFYFTKTQTFLLQ